MNQPQLLNVLSVVKGGFMEVFKSEALKEDLIMFQSLNLVSKEINNLNFQGEIWREVLSKNKIEHVKRGRPTFRINNIRYCKRCQRATINRYWSMSFTSTDCSLHFSKVNMKVYMRPKKVIQLPTFEQWMYRTQSYPSTKNRKGVSQKELDRLERLYNFEMIRQRRRKEMITKKRFCKC